MKQLLQMMLLAALLNACGSNKNYLERSDEKKALFDAVKKLNKNGTDEQASIAVPILYSSILKTKQAKIKSFESGKDINRWDHIIGEYNDLQEAYNSIINSNAAFKLITPENFSTQLLEAKQYAAADYYEVADVYLTKNGRDNAKNAYNNFKKADKYIPGYKEVLSKMNQAYENAIVDVVINPVQDDRYFFNSGWGNSGYDYSNEYFQRTLVRDLAYNNNSSNTYAARFYSDWEARRENVEPDWTIDLGLRNINLPQPSTYNNKKERSAQVQNGTDTSGKPTYKTVYATLNITRMSFNAHADMDVLIKDLETPKTISNTNFREDYRWQAEKATYTGDSRALSSADWEIINNNNFYQPRREDILNELYKKIYPQ
ncbi:MAG: hypothetical protein ACOYLO_05510, partial [Ferruginibacter sp.]